MNPLCENCDYRDDPYGEGFCYMFREKPPIVDKWGHCAQHPKVPKVRGPAAHLIIFMAVHGRGSDGHS